MKELDWTGSFDKLLRDYQEGNPTVINRRVDEFACEIKPGSSYEEKCRALKGAIEFLASLEPGNALGDGDIRRFVGFFDRLYRDEDGKFRHSYADVCEVMYGFLDTSQVEDGCRPRLDNGVPFQNVNLENNIVAILSAIESGNDVDRHVLNGVRKLKDHIRLENQRMNYMAHQNRMQMRNADELERQFNERIEGKLFAAKDDFDAGIKKSQQEVQRNNITILGIFAAIVIAFTSGATFSSSVLQNISDVSIYRLTFIVLAVGFLIFNMLCALFVFLERLAPSSGRKMAWLVVPVDVAIVAMMGLVVLARSVDLVGMMP